MQPSDNTSSWNRYQSSFDVPPFVAPDSVRAQLATAFLPCPDLALEAITSDSGINATTITAAYLSPLPMDAAQAAFNQVASAAVGFDVSPSLATVVSNLVTSVAQAVAPKGIPDAQSGLGGLGEIPGTIKVVAVCAAILGLVYLLSGFRRAR